MITAGQQVIVTTLKKGKSWSPEGGDEPITVQPKFDAIVLTVKITPDQSSTTLISYANHAYKQNTFYEPLVP